MVWPANSRVEITSWLAWYCSSSECGIAFFQTFPRRRGDEIGGRPELDSAVGQHRHPRAEIGDVVDDMGRQDDDDIVADLGQQVEEAVALLRVEAGGRLVDDDQLWIADQRLGDAETLAHAAGEACDRLVADSPEVGLVEQRLDHCLAVGLARDSLEDGDLVEHRVGGDARIDAEILRQIAQPLAQLSRVSEDVDVAEADRFPAVGS